MNTNPIERSYYHKTTESFVMKELEIRDDG
jgi:hypothetical protein